MNTNALLTKFTSRMFQKVDGVVWDLATGGLGLKTPDNSIITLTADENIAEDGTVTIDYNTDLNPIDVFGMTIPAYALATPIDQVAEGDLVLFKNNQVGGWVTKKHAASFDILKADGTTSNYKPQRVQMMGTGSTTILVIRSLFSMFGGNQAALGGFQNNLMPLLLLSKDGGDGGKLEKLLPIMLMSSLNGGAGNQQAGGFGGGNMMQTMLMMQVIGGKDAGGGLGDIFGGGDDLMTMMMLGGMGGAQAGGSNNMMQTMLMASLLKK